jgi:hypothetical protein
VLLIMSLSIEHLHFAGFTVGEVLVLLHVAGFIT